MTDRRKLSSMLAALTALGLHARIVRTPQGEEGFIIDGLSPEEELKAMEDELPPSPGSGIDATFEEMAREFNELDRRLRGVIDGYQHFDSVVEDLRSRTMRHAERLSKIEDSVVSNAETHQAAHQWMERLQSDVEAIRNSYQARATTAEQRRKEMIELDTALRNTDKLRGEQIAEVYNYITDLKRRIQVLETKPARPLKKAKRVKRGRKMDHSAD